ncbi:uncharacterized protein LOC135164772 [Diachasmimorpha longicaudata]|uniref:uncharacterized protein LOC135164772 n=1 Tax=Diachasmimorpha longicaudata TaxID=58733 RepID=UPI0030B8F5D0
MVKLIDNRGKTVLARALLDSCSTVNLITQRFAQSLRLNTISCSVNIGAVDGLCTIAERYSQLEIQSNHNDFRQKLNFLIVPQIAERIPNELFPRQLFDIPKNLKLADPQFHLPRAVDLLIASNTMLSVLSVGQIKLRHKHSSIVIQKTRLGWIVAGGSEIATSSTNSPCNVVKLDKLIERFWVIEDFDHDPVRSRDEISCEQHYLTHTKRDVTGRYIVRLPFRDSKFNLGESRIQALKRFQALERKLSAKASLRLEYTRVMEEYISLGHMTLCDEIEGGCYLPHHAVIKESSETTKVRVVFDASAKTSTGISLNDTLLVGPTIQNTIFEQVLRFRVHRYVITADIEKMYRQILVHPEDCQFQKVLWTHHGQLRTFQLNTVTFGTASAPFLAVRTLQQLARDEAEHFPRASKLLLRDFYVDDFISGADSLDELLTIRDEMIALLARGGFKIRQWASNHSAVLNSIDKKFFDLDCLVRTDPIKKTLGIIWDAESDVLRYTIAQVNPNVSATKRKLLSELSKIFDPLGLLGPITLLAKTLIQDCWKAKITWDESLPQDIHSKWISLASQLPSLHDVVFSRQILIPNAVSIELHGFCDASINGYGACLYIKSQDSQGTVAIRLISSKSRVAPLKGVTIPRLELCAASVLKKLYVETRAQIEFSINQVYLWSDSTIVLCWLKKAPHLLRTFEANRVADIQTLGDEVIWKHIRSEDNPADALSRGQRPLEFLKNTLWTTGPEWLVHDQTQWPNSILPSNLQVPALKKGVCLLAEASPEAIYARFSNFERLTRVIARILRWKNSEISRSSTLSIEDLQEAEYRILAMIQRERFSNELRKLATTHDSSESVRPRRTGTPFDQLHPFIDDKGILRVGGRLTQSELPFNRKHPILLPSKHLVTDMLIRRVHQSNYHAGIQTTLYILRSKYWILNGKDQIRKIVHSCLECIRQRPKFAHAQMADLPKFRVNEAPAFAKTGVDFFGPILIKEKKDRNRSFLKAYGCVFICMVSKAVHIELAIDLSTEGFLAAFRRFVSRRGVPEHMYSDNGTNFVGANRELDELYSLISNPEFEDTVGAYATSKRIRWHFNPPLSPHFGGIWEAAVKSFKHHLKRVLKDHKLTYEQLNTFLIEIEAILNSRPLCALSADPNDPIAITPAHLLIGRPFNQLPERSFSSVAVNRLSIYNFITKAKQDFWNKWHKEYLHELQTRHKWQDSTAELQVGSVVLLMDDHLTCARWPLGVITEVFPGNDGVARVATIRTTNGTFKRNITRLCMLPIT